MRHDLMICFIRGEIARIIYLHHNWRNMNKFDLLECLSVYDTVH